MRRLARMAGKCRVGRTVKPCSYDASYRQKALSLVEKGPLGVVAGRDLPPRPPGYEPYDASPPSRAVSQRPVYKSVYRTGWVPHLGWVMSCLSLTGLISGAGQRPGRKRG